MELYSNEIDSLKKLVREWLPHEHRELEATFAGASDATTFLSVAQRLKGKGYTEIRQEDKLNIITPETVRFTLTGTAAIESYCRTDELEGKPFEAIIKDRAGPESNVDIDEYGIRVKARREIPLTQTDATIQDMMKRWPTQKKAFRIIKRWSFMDEKKGLRFDLSMVRSTPKDSRGFLWQTTFQQKDITSEPIGYEIEVELVHPSDIITKENLNELADKHLKNLISGVGDVLRGIQKHIFLIRRSTAMKALNSYKQLVGSDRFRGVQPKPMEKKNMSKQREDKVPNIRDGYNVTDKADGLRMMGFVDADGELFLIDMSLNIYRTGLRRDACRLSLVDGEFINQDKEGKSMLQYLIFDIYIAPEKTDVTQMPFKSQDGEDRYTHMQGWLERWTKGDGPSVVPGAGVTGKNRILVGVKEFRFAEPGDTQIFSACGNMLAYAGTQPYNTDGLILTPNAAPIPQKHSARFPEQLKWKPSHDNTIDFLVLFDKEETGEEKVTTGVEPGTNASVNYKTMRLYIGSENDPAYLDPRGTVLFEQPLPGVRGTRKYRPVLFNPVEFPDTMANTCHAEIEVDEETGESIVRANSGDAVMHNSIVEMTYVPSHESGWRWVPLRVRHDKTERYQRGIAGRTFNNDEGAEIVWNSIHDPVTEHMIITGDDTPSLKELSEMAPIARREKDIYYDRKDVKEDTQIIRGLRDFHRLYIKEDILLGRGLRGGGKVLADLACGQGGDLNTWIREKVGFVYGTDIAGDGITNPNSGAYRRYLNQVMRYGGYDTIPKMIFTIGSSAKRLSTGEAGATPEEANIMRTVFGTMNADGPVPPFITKYGASRLRNGADCVAIMFAIHYFFENEISLQNIMTNISDSLKVGGLFVGCCFDGETVFKELQSIPENGSIVGQQDGAEIWKITKKYGNTDITSGTESLGMGIDVKFMSIGTEQREYLVPFELLKKEMLKIGCELLTTEECKELSIQKSTNLFSESFAMAQKQGKKFPMSADVARYSFLNRWFIFKRRRIGIPEEEVENQAMIDVSSSSNVRRAIQEAKAELKGPAVERKESLAEKAVKANEAAMNKGKKEEEEIKIAMDKVVPGAVAEKTKFELAELYQFYLDASLADKQLKMGDPEAARWISPSSHFPIKDKDDTQYPSVEHYYYAMKFKLASNKPELAPAIFGVEGKIHQEFNTMRNAEKVAAPITSDRDNTLVKEERKQVLDVFSVKQIKKYGVVINEGKWSTIKDDVLHYALEQRYELDARYRKIVEKVKSMGLYLIYYTGASSSSELGAKRKADKTIDGENKIGKMMMEIAGFRF
jgi:hypothetical protein